MSENFINPAPSPSGAALTTIKCSQSSNSISDTTTMLHVPGRLALVLLFLSEWELFCFFFPFVFECSYWNDNSFLVQIIKGKVLQENHLLNT